LPRPAREFCLFRLDADSNAQLVKGESLVNAIRKGYVWAHPGKTGQRTAAPGAGPSPAVAAAKGTPATAPARGLIRQELFEIGPEVLALYALARARFPVEYGQATLQEFVEDCIFGFFAVRGHVFGLDALLSGKLKLDTDGNLRTVLG
jgi:hypothetical protein